MSKLLKHLLFNQLGANQAGSEAAKPAEIAQTDVNTKVAESAESAETEEKSPFPLIKTLADVRRTYFQPSQLEAANSLINHVANLCATETGKEPLVNFDPNEFPDGYGITIQPISTKDKESKKTVVTGVGIGAIPAYETLMADKAGAEWGMGSVITAMQQKFSNACRDYETDEDTLPFSLTDFITSARAEGVLNGYRHVAPDTIRALKTMGMKYLTDAVFRQCLTSAAYAETQFPISQDKWEMIIKKMIAKCEAEGINPGLMSEWVETRKTAGLPDIKEIDLSDLDI